MPLANAHPKKRFFIQMFTRDIPLQDCILDLIDNCIDGLARNGQLQMHTISDDIFGRGSNSVPRKADRPYVQIEFGRNRFRIIDSCGGIDYQYALDDVFNFGHSITTRSKEYLGVYGVGMKRALFKMGKRFVMQSKTIKNGFKCDLDVEKWMTQDAKMEDWTIDLTEIPAARIPAQAGTEIVVEPLQKEVEDLLSLPRFERDLSKAIGRVYAFLVDKYVRISVNGVDVKAFSVPVGEPRQGQTSYEEFKHDGVKVRIFATLSTVGSGNERPTKENSGWYVACNGRLILVADTSELTGWGVKPMPIWVPKYTSFIGFVFFEAKNALELPWTTTKRSVNGESAVYRKTISRMAVLARPILTFCNRKYPSDEDQEPIEREIAKEMKPTTIAQLVRKAGSAFMIEAPNQAAKRTTVSVQYNAKQVDIEKIRKHLRNPRMGAAKIGEHTFDYFLRQEGLK
ncbi:MAG: ATP-binding protein [Proteobacteria bacterium]|nr:ATP-binding protein [Pseudomonadota bacterium]